MHQSVCACLRVIWRNCKASSVYYVCLIYFTYIFSNFNSITWDQLFRCCRLCVTGQGLYRNFDRNMHDYTITITYDQDQTIMRFWHAHSAGGDAHHAHAPDLVVALLLGALDPDDLHRRYSHEARSAWPTRWTKQMERGSLALGSVQRQWTRNMFKHHWQQRKHDCVVSCLRNSQLLLTNLRVRCLNEWCTWNGVHLEWANHLATG